MRHSPAKGRGDVTRESGMFLAIGLMLWLAFGFVATLAFIGFTGVLQGK